MLSFIIVSVVVILIIGGIYFFTRNNYLVGDTKVTGGGNQAAYPSNPNIKSVIQPGSLRYNFMDVNKKPRMKKVRNFFVPIVNK